MREALESPGAREANDEFLASDREFHVRIASAASNRVLQAIVRDIHELLTTSWRWSALSPSQLEARVSTA